MARTQAFKVQVEAFKRTIQESHAAAMERAARATFRDAQTRNKAELGFEPPHQWFVDGRASDNLRGVKRGGRIECRFDVAGGLLEKAVDLAIAEFMRLAPVGSPPEDKHPGLYRRSLRMMVNGAQRDASRERSGVVRLKRGDVVTLTNLLPYARRLERGWSRQAPNGILEKVAMIVRRRYGSLLNVRFSWAAYSIGGGAVAASRRSRRASQYPTITMSMR